MDWQIVGVGDFNADAAADILFYHPTGGEIGQFVMKNGQAVGWAEIGWAGPDWQIVGVGDFDGDGTPDILFHNLATGTLGQFQMKNGQAVGWAGIGWAGPDWRVAATGDFDGDGTTDILFYNPTTGEVGQFQMHNGQATWLGIGAITGAAHPMPGGQISSGNTPVPRPATTAQDANRPRF